MKRAIITLLFALQLSNAMSQDMFRIGVGADFTKNKREFVQLFSFDFNRTESASEKVGKSLLNTRNGFYITPSADVNLGPKPSSSENNLSAQFTFGHVRRGDIKYILDSLGQRRWRHSIELNPVYNSDKNFGDILLYGQLLYRLNLNGSLYSSRDQNNGFLKRAFMFSLSPTLNFGNRYNDSLSVNTCFSQLGGDLEFNYRLRKKKTETVDGSTTTSVFDRWVFKLNLTSFAVLQDLRETYTNDFAGRIKASVDFAFNKSFGLSLAYKYGNFSPTYQEYHTLDFGIKIKYQ